MTTPADTPSADETRLPADLPAASQEKVFASGRYARRIGLGATAQFLAAVLQQFLKFLASWLIARLLGRLELGIFTLSLTFWSAVQMSYSGGLIRSVTRFTTHHMARGELAETKGVIRIAAYCAWIGGGLLALLMYFTADLVAVHVLNRPETGPSLRLLALFMPFTGICTVVWSSARSLGSFSFIVYQFIVVPLLFAALIVPIALMHGNAAHLALAYGLSFVLPLAPLWRYHRRVTAFLREVQPRLLWTPFVSFAMVGLLLWLSEFIARNLDMVLLGRMTSAGDAGVYAIAVRNAMLSHVVLISINAFFSPTISSLHSGGRHEELRQLFSRASLWILITSVPLIVFTMALAEPLMLLFREEFAAGALALWILAAGQLVNVGTGLIATALSMTGRHPSVLITNLLGIVVTGGLCLWLIPLHGASGAALASATSVIFVNVTLSIWGYVSMRVSPLSLNYPKPLIAAAVAGLITQTAVGFTHILALKLLGGFALFLIVYLLLMLLLGMKGEAMQAFGALRQGMQRKAAKAQPAEGDNQASPVE